MTAAEAVAGGAQFLDEKLPGWWNRVDTKTLDMESTTNCVLGQLYHTLGLRARLWTHVYKAAGYSQWGATARAIGIETWQRADALGFDSHWLNANRPFYFELEQEWLLAIERRRGFDALPEWVDDGAPLVEEKEAVLA